MNNFSLPNNQSATSNVTNYTGQPLKSENFNLLKLVCMAVGHQPLNIGHKQTMGTYPGTRKQVYVQHRVCKRCNCIINSVTTVVDVD